MIKFKNEDYLELRMLIKSEITKIKKNVEIFEIPELKEIYEKQLKQYKRIKESLDKYEMKLIEKTEV